MSKTIMCQKDFPFTTMSPDLFLSLGVKTVIMFSLAWCFPEFTGLYSSLMWEYFSELYSLDKIYSKESEY